jgi:hypothetical protein
MSHLQQIARAAALRAQQKWYGLTTSQEPCDFHEFVADAVAVAVLQAIRERVGNQADRCRNEVFDALWRVCSGLDEDLQAFETGNPPHSGTCDLNSERSAENQRVTLASSGDQET